MDVSFYQAQQYDSPPCWQLVALVYARELDKGVDAYRTVSNSVRDIARTFRLELHKQEHGFARIADPVDFAVVLMGKTRKLGMHHCGVFYQGKVLHALDSGVLYQDLASLQDRYMLMEFWAR